MLKFANSPQGPDIPFRESMGTELYRSYGLVVPAWNPIHLTDAFIDQNPSCWMQTAEGSVRPAAGLCFGSRYLGSYGERLFEVLPGNWFTRVHNRTSFWLAWAIDVCARHTDNRQAVFVSQPSGEIRAYFMDHGHLFGGQSDAHRNYIAASRYLDARIYPSLTARAVNQLRRQVSVIHVDELWKKAQSLPEEWRTAPAIYAFGQGLNRLSTHKHIADVIEQITEQAGHQNSHHMHSVVTMRENPRALAANIS